MKIIDLNQKVLKENWGLGDKQKEYRIFVKSTRPIIILRDERFCFFKKLESMTVETQTEQIV
jgi:hypothetical protein